ncbi:hypothetical protein R9C00_27500 [Flammeovirgaceae bacterium SG7u.111]|nr:hypothetical protein [Flammeovirgaceae bacterium SG7u.132]WPO35446.1 hypothetical protein R9C00_27500 [Flammeovirgaceae bacterium SG7u.111]
MKKSLLLFCSLLFITNLLHAQCNPYFNYTEGTEIVMESFNGKGKLDGSQKISILEVADEAGAQKILSSSVLMDKKGEQITEMNYTLTCEGGNIKMDMSRFAMQNSAMDQMEGISVEIDGDHMVIPSSLSVGETLPDANFTTTIKSDNPAMAAMMGAPSNFRIYNRKVEKKETLETSAGSFECYKITYKFDAEVKIMGMTQRMTSSGAEWITEKVGMVRTENFDKKGKLVSYSQIASFKQ